MVEQPADRILLLGASGFLGSFVAGALLRREAAQLVLHAGSRPEGAGPSAPGALTVHADLTEERSVSDLLERTSPRLIVNCVALADVDRCEREPDLAEALNHRLPVCLARWAADCGADLVHVSTDAVFDGRSGPYGVGALTQPVNAYGRSKLDGEVGILEALPAAAVVRTNIVGWSPTGRRSLLEFFHDRLVRGEVTPGFTDALFRPLPVQRFWPTCEVLLAAGMSGVMHATGPELLSKYAFGVLVARTFGLDPALVVPSRLADAGLVAYRGLELDVLPTLLPDGSMPVAGSLQDGLRELRDLQERWRPTAER